MVFLAGIAVSFMMVGRDAVLGMSGMETTDTSFSAAGAVLAELAGGSQVISILYPTKLHDRSVVSDAILRTRFILIAVIAAASESSSDQ